MAMSNTIGCMMFVRALTSSGSSLPAIVVNSANNYFCSVSKAPRCEKMHLYHYPSSELQLSQHYDDLNATAYLTTFRDAHCWHANKVTDL
jgi:hypothetical protein